MNKRLISLAFVALGLFGCNPPPSTLTQEARATMTDAAQASPSPSPMPEQILQATTPTHWIAFPDFPDDLLFENLPTGCPGIGSQAYREPPIELATISQGDDPPLVLERGTVIVVTTYSDEANGDTSNLRELLGNPGPDGISLREALLVANNDPGEYTIQFDSHLMGAVIRVGSWDHTELPALEGGSVIINGDVDGDQGPDISLINDVAELTDTNAIFGLRIQSSNNIVHALKITGFTVGAFFDAPSSHQTYSHNTISRLEIEGGGGIALYSSHGSDDVPIEKTYNRWEDTRIVGNKIISHNGGGISFAMHWASMETVEHLIIQDNHIQIINEIGSYGGNGIELSPGFGAGSDGNLFQHVLIANNVIEGNPSSGIGFLNGFMGAGGNLIRQVHILGNTIKGSYSYDEYMHTFGIHISAGFWVNQEGNEISDILVANNTIEGNSEMSVLLSSGAVGSSGNLVERIRFSNNQIKVTQHTREDGIPIMAVGITTGDGATDYFDPNFQPVVYPNDNVLRDVWFSGNVIEGQGGYAVMFSTGVPGVESNTIESIYIVGNDIDAFFPEKGILVSAISLEHGGNGDNRISRVYIQQNSIHYTNLREDFGGEEFVSGGIVLSAGNGTTFSSTQDVWIVANEISSPAPGINLVAGWSQPDFPPSVGNTISGVRMWCNQVAENPMLLESLFPGIKGINLAGGWGLASENRVADISIAKNQVAGVMDDVSVFDNAGDGSEGNSVHLP